MDENKKKVDEGWKEQVEKEKEQIKEGAEEKQDFSVPEPTFSFFVTTLSVQASISLGFLENPATNKKEENLEQAKFLIDTLSMVQEKTKGNLSDEEKNLLDNLLFELRNAYIAKTKGSAE
jgi:hypothetical protein